MQFLGLQITQISFLPSIQLDATSEVVVQNLSLTQVFLVLEQSHRIDNQPVD